MKVVVVDYQVGNLNSVIYALNRIGVEALVSNDKKIIECSDRVILPGVGHAARAMESLNRHFLVGTIKSLKMPVLGICLGMQILFDYSEEGQTDCLGVVGGKVSRFKNDKKVPQIGWNKVSKQPSSRLQNNISDSFFYFVHSYKAEVDDKDALEVNSCYLEEEFCSLVEKNNFYGVQFHPERSSLAGEALLKNFVELI